MTTQVIPEIHVLVDTIWGRRTIAEAGAQCVPSLAIFNSSTVTVTILYHPYFSADACVQGAHRHGGSQVSSLQDEDTGYLSFNADSCSARIQNPAPLDYATPPFPSLYWPYKAKPGVANYLYYADDIWRHTILWTLILYAVFHLTVAAFAVLMQLGKGKRAWQYVWIIPLVYTLIAGVEALLAGSIVGLMSVSLLNVYGPKLTDPSLGAVYNAGYFKMSTWLPFIWSLINVLVLIVSSFSIQGGL